MGRKHNSKTLNTEEVVWDGTWECPRSTSLAVGSAGTLRKLRHINQKKQFWGFSQALTFIQSIGKSFYLFIFVGDFCWPERLTLNAICSIKAAGNADELWVISSASCSSKGGEANAKLHKNSTESCGGGVLGREGDSPNPNNTLWNSVLLRLTGFAKRANLSHAHFATAEESLGTNYRRLKGKRTVPWSILKWGVNHRGSWTQDAQRQEQDLDGREQQTGVGGGGARLGSTACVTHSPKSIFESLTAEKEPAKRLSCYSEI